MRKERRLRHSADVDITPLIDMMFMLIIFFVLTASFVSGKVEVELPSGRGLSSSQEKAVIVSIASDGAVKWDGRNVSERQLAGLARASRGHNVLIAGDKGAAYGKVADILSILRSNGVTSAGLLMQGDRKE